MPKSGAPPSGWEQTLDQPTFESFMDRENTTVAFVRFLTGRKVIRTDVHEPNGFGRWGYLVHAADPEYCELDHVDGLQTAREIVHEFMEEYPT